MNIVTVPDYPPIPTREFDWSAYEEGTIDLCGDPWCGCHAALIVGRGPTEEDAVFDLITRLAHKRLEDAGVEC